MTATIMMNCVTLTRRFRTVGLSIEVQRRAFGCSFRVMESLMMVPYVLVVDLKSSNQTIVKMNYGCSENIERLL